MLARDFQLPALALDLTEEPGVLNRQCGLRGERSQDLNDLGGKRAGRATSDDEAPDDALLVKQRDRRARRASPSRATLRAADSRRRLPPRCPGSGAGSRVTAIWPTAPSPRRSRVARSNADWLPSALSVARGENSSAPSSYLKIVPPSVPESWTARPTIVVRTVSRSSEELTARPTSPRAVSWRRPSGSARASAPAARSAGARSRSRSPPDRRRSEEARFRRRRIRPVQCGSQ